MDNIIQELFNGILKRLDKIEKGNTNNTRVYDKTKKASEKQIMYVKSLDVDPWEGMTSGDVTDIVKNPSKFKKEHKESPEIEAQIKATSGKDNEEYPDY